MIHEGIDHSLFFPGPRSGVLDPDCFYVFSGGKVEFRKAHDLVILAFREFAARHDDAVLVAAWNSPWPEVSVLREMDCALQVSRCEACTNLPAKEAMACGVPVILAKNTGTLDLIDGDNCVALTTQDPVMGQPGMGTDEWGESRVEEIVSALEKLYTDTQMRKRIGAHGVQWIVDHGRTWQTHANKLKAHVLSLL
jgi:glycosyltransferase involved in cell wall biosynthesis